ncbi:tripartite tricarboxylate transporter TctB family protein [Nesterenkonia suensis]
MTEQTESRASARIAWRIAGGGGLVMAALVGWVSFTGYHLGSLDRPGAGVFPLLVAGVLAAASALTLLQSGGATSSAPSLGEDRAWLRLVLGGAVLLGSALLMPHVGFLPVVVVGGLMTAVLIEREFRWTMPVTMVIMGVTVWAVFELLLGIRLPGVDL